MKPLRLSLEGFTCFREPTTVTFEDLSLFGIEGPTGSGKSTLLDALTYALYGKTARLGTQVGDALFSPGVEQLWVSFEFAVGEQIYRATRTSEVKSSGRPSNRADIEHLVGADWKKLPETEKISEAVAKVEQIIGLDYDGFTRAVMLPQGAFDEFLRGDASKRRKLLVKLLGLDRIEMMQREANQRARDAEHREKSIRERLDQDFGAATPERRRSLTEELERLEAQRQELESSRQTLDREVDALEQLKTLLDEQTKLVATLDELKMRADDIEGDKHALARARDAQGLAPLLELAATQQQRLDETQSALTELESNLENLRLEASATEKALKKATEQASRLPDIGARLESLAGVGPLMKLLTSRGGSLDLAAERDVEAPYDEAAWSALQQRSLDLEQLRHLGGELAELEKRRSEATTLLAQEKRGIKEIEAELAALKREGRQARAAYNEAKTAHERALDMDRAAVLRAHLHVGEACPVCEQQVVAVPEALPSRAGKLASELAQAETTLQAKLDAYHRLELKHTAAKGRSESLAAEVERLGETLDKQTEREADLLKPLRSFGSDLAAIEAGLQRHLRRSLAALAVEVSRTTEGHDPAALQQELKAERTALSDALQRAEERHRKAVAEREKAESRKTLLETRLAEQLQDVKASQANLDQALAKAGFGDVAEARGALLSEARLKSLEARVQTHQDLLRQTEQRAVEVQAAVAERELDGAAYEKLVQEQRGFAARLEDTQRKIGAAQRDLAALKEQLGRAKELRAELKAVQTNFDTYRQLSLDLRSNAFQDYLMTRVQQELAVRASKIIRDVTDGRYDLRLSDGDYQVLDAWNTGELRSAKTLSGGETFIVSLALALALSDTLANNRALGALFLDEGFGTLDAVTLDAVAQVLESLSEQGRMVGVITHVTALTERLPARLKVSKGAEGSTVAWDI